MISLKIPEIGGVRFEADQVKREEGPYLKLNETDSMPCKKVVDISFESSRDSYVDTPVVVGLTILFKNSFEHEGKSVSSQTLKIVEYRGVIPHHKPYDGEPRISTTTQETQHRIPEEDGECHATKSIDDLVGEFDHIQSRKEEVCWCVLPSDVHSTTQFEEGFVSRKR